MEGKARVGEVWQSVGGEREIIGYGSHPSTGEPCYVIATNGRQVGALLVNPEDIESEIDFDRRSILSRIKGRIKQAGIAVAAAGEQAKYEDLDGFTDDMEPLKRARVIKTLNVQQCYNGVFYLRKDYIKQAIVNSSRVECHKTLGRILRHTSGSFMDALTKTELDYAEYLTV